LQQNGELKTVSGTPVRAPTKMMVHVKNVIFYQIYQSLSSTIYKKFTDWIDLFA
jgi:hypothetical protein